VLHCEETSLRTAGNVKWTRGQASRVAGTIEPFAHLNGDLAELGERR
jgi:hypothetical protein